MKSGADAALEDVEEGEEEDDEEDILVYLRISSSVSMGAQPPPSWEHRTGDEQVVMAMMITT